MWIEREELPNFLESFHNSSEEAPGKGDLDERTGLCPSGHGVMIRARVDAAEPFYLEKCPRCGGIWFDQGEWLKIAQTTFSENLSDLWCKSWQYNQRKEKERSVFLEINKQLLGEDIFQEIMNLASRLREHPEKGRAIAFLQQEANSRNTLSYARTERPL